MRSGARDKMELGATIFAGAAIYFCVYRLSIFAGLGPLRNLVATLLATIPTVVLARSVERQEQHFGAAELALLIGGLTLLRLGLPAEQLVGSDDAYRYLWDGLVQSNGINPYAHAPASAELSALRDQRFFAHIFRPDLRTVYPPLAQLWFRLAYAISPGGFLGLKLILLVHEIATAVLLVRLLIRLELPPGRAWLYAFSPLAVVQLHAGAHLDGLLLPWLIAALLFAERRPTLAGAALAASAMVRPLTALCAPALLFPRPIKESARVALGGLAALVVLSVPFASAGKKIFESLLVYGQHWRFNGAFFRLPDAIWGEDPDFRMVLYGGIALAAVAVGVFWRKPRHVRFFAALMVYIAWAPTIYPWYFLPLVAIGAITGGPLQLLLPALCSLSDLVFVSGVQGGQWTVPTLALIVEWVGIFGLFFYQLWLGRSQAR